MSWCVPNVRRPNLIAQRIFHAGSPTLRVPQVENCIGVAAVPLGVAPNFVVNGQHYVVPMAVEEPSVIAAASGVAKLLSGHGGFTASSTPNVMTAEVQSMETTLPLQFLFLYCRRRNDCFTSPRFVCCPGTIV